MGLVDQHGISSLNKSIDGGDDGILATLLMSSQLGAFRSGKGLVRINRSPGEDIRANLVRGLIDPFPKNWAEASEHFENLGMDVIIQISEEEPDLWVGQPQLAQVDKNAGLWVVHGNGRAVSGSGSMSMIPTDPVPETMLDSPSLVCGVASLIHRMLHEDGLFWEVPVSDRWLTLTARVDGLGPEEASKQVYSKFGPGISSSTIDGLGSLIRFRIPVYETPPSLLEMLEQTRKHPHVCLELADVGPFSAFSEDGSVSFQGDVIPAILEEGDFFILGAGGTGSWASTMILSGCGPGVSLTIVDGDQEVESHNLNRQVLYRDGDIGKPKATAAGEALSRMFPGSSSLISAIPIPLGPHHVRTNGLDDSGEVISLEEITGGELANDEEITSSLDKMDVALSCLDNQISRTWLNRACLERGKEMVNGGSEGVRGMIEVFDEDSCMVCRYGEEEAMSSEVVSCQEEGTRPVSSIVTTTAYVGSMMAAIALCVIARSRLAFETIPPDRDWFSGDIQNRPSGRLPWFGSDCRSHL